MKNIITAFVVALCVSTIAFSQPDTAIYYAANNKPGNKDNGRVSIFVFKKSKKKFELQYYYKYDEKWKFGHKKK